MEERERERVCLSFHKLLDQIQVLVSCLLLSPKFLSSFLPLSFSLSFSLLQESASFFSAPSPLVEVIAFCIFFFLSFTGREKEEGRETNRII